jgi:YHYH protein
MSKILGICLGLIFLFQLQLAQAQDPRLISWWMNSTGNMYNGILTDVEAVYYNTNNVYVMTSGVPNYYVDGASVNNAKDLNAAWVIPRNPVVATTHTGLVGGQNGLMRDGSLCFHPGDARSYNNLGVWNQLAYYFELFDMDVSNGHSTPGKVYHHHFNNLKVHNTADSTVHSPIVGFAWDGYPIYGPYGYSNSNGTGGIIRNTSSYTKKTYTTRTNGPAVNATYPIGCYIEDWQYISGAGTLDQYNGRFVVTPEFPTGTYAYFTTVDATLTPQYPYFIGPTFYGTFTNANLGPSGGTAAVPTGTTLYTATALGIDSTLGEINVVPDESIQGISIKFDQQGHYEVHLHDLSGKLISRVEASNTIQLQIPNLPAGLYIVNIRHVLKDFGVVKRYFKSN